MARRRRPIGGIDVGAHLVRDALACHRIQSKSFRPPSEGESLFSGWPEKSNQKRGHPDGAPSRHRATAPCAASTRASMPSPAFRVRGWATGFFASTSCAGEKLAGIPAGHPAGFPSPTRRAIGAPGRAARSRRALFRRTRSRAKRQSATLPLWLFSFITECGPRWPAALPGVPCAAVSRGRQAAQRVSPWMDSPFRAGRSPLEKPGPDSRTGRAWMPGKRQAGCSFSSVTFSLSTQRESDSASAGGRKLFAPKTSGPKPPPQARMPC